jgi:hypothetical protein
MRTVALALLTVSALCVLGCTDNTPAPKPAATSAATAAAPATSASAAVKKAPGGGW